MTKKQLEDASVIVAVADEPTATPPLPPEEYLLADHDYDLESLAGLLGLNPSELAEAVGMSPGELNEPAGNEPLGMAPAILRRIVPTVRGARVIEAIRAGLRVQLCESLVRQVMRQRERQAADERAAAARAAEAQAKANSLVGRTAGVAEEYRRNEQSQAEAADLERRKAYREILSRELTGKSRPDDPRSLAQVLYELGKDVAEVEGDLKALRDVAVLEDLMGRTDEAREELQKANDARKEMQERHEREAREADQRVNEARRFSSRASDARFRAEQIRKKHPLAFSE